MGEEKKKTTDKLVFSLLQGYRGGNGHKKGATGESRFLPDQIRNRRKEEMKGESASWMTDGGSPISEETIV